MRKAERGEEKVERQKEKVVKKKRKKEKIIEVEFKLESFFYFKFDFNMINCDFIIESFSFFCLLRRKIFVL